ncbi:Dps family protein [Saccharophagus degradans]|uniref:Ferritin and Dps n=2 Tax=Saccharophagus degradans TaxID=86304 RepID=Q21N02_SACD2|nr:Dps family protein [Saccharophagus degradans]ABD79927.1 Ferritin and Dps [Saccharophagus degradans 2-40]MBU2983785.1 DNA starvation/stationary phase protection protein [Saccharophagus degradans]MDO6422241.1 Dps family protein [Saccharophagus degradans]MDO6607484.1 Dps family protein [Saccharophagus degradans]WGO97909.1 Dps family protein [Saccharophagus degradans]
MTINIGISESNRKDIVQALSHLLADSYVLYLKTHNFHWNVTGPMFQTLHNMFMDQYTEAWTALDTIAERIRTLGFPAPGSYKQFMALTSLKEEEGVPSAEDMVQQLLEGQETLVRIAREGMKIAEAADDQSSADLFTQRIEVHEKNAWMLRSLKG